MSAATQPDPRSWSLGLRPRATRRPAPPVLHLPVEAHEPPREAAGNDLSRRELGESIRELARLERARFEEQVREIAARERLAVKEELDRLEQAQAKLAGILDELSQRNPEDLAVLRQEHKRDLGEIRRLQASVEDLASMLDPFDDAPAARFWERWADELSRDVDPLSDWVGDWIERISAGKGSVEPAELDKVLRRVAEAVTTMSEFRDGARAFAADRRRLAGPARGRS